MVTDSRSRSPMMKVQTTVPITMHFYYIGVHINNRILTKRSLKRMVALRASMFTNKTCSQYVYTFEMDEEQLASVGCDQLPACRPYHPASELSKMPGYYPNISSEQLAAACQVLAVIRSENLNFNTDEEDSFLKALRFLRARKFNVKNALAMIREDVHWRAQSNRLDLPKESAQEVLNCNIEKIYNFFPVWFQGFDKQMRPVSYRKFGKFEIWNVLKLTTMDRLIRFHAWETEQALRSMYSLSRKSGYNIETFVIVIDASGWNLKLATSDAFTFIKGMAVTDSDHYPERLGTLVLINAPSVLSFAWRVIQGFLDNVTKEKIKILSSNPEEWQPVLRHYIDNDQIPMQYGGTAPDPTSEQAIGAMNPPRGETGPVLAVAAATAAPTDDNALSTGISTSSGQVRQKTGANFTGTPIPTKVARRESLKRAVSFSPVSVVSSGGPSSADSSSRMGTAAAAAARQQQGVDVGVQTDEGLFIMAHEVGRVQRAGCAIL